MAMPSLLVFPITLLAWITTVHVVSLSPISQFNLALLNGTKPIAKARNKAVRIPGDIILGGLFPVHQKSISGEKQCGPINRVRGLQRVEVMLFTIKEINSRMDILPDITLGANILDTCSRDTYALEQSLEYVRASMSSLDASEFTCQDGSKAKAKPGFKAVACVIGGAYSSVSIQVANLLRLFRIPQVSYASTSAALSDKGRFDYFARTLPPDTFQAKAMVDIVQYFNWTYVSTLASEGDYGENGIEFFIQEARAKNICIALQKKIPTAATAVTFDEIIVGLLKQRNAKVVILFIREEDAVHLLAAATRQNCTDHFVWIASDGWGKQDTVKDNFLAAEGAITLELQTYKITPFDDYFTSLHPENHTINPWFADYWEDLHKCSFKQSRIDGNSTPACTGQERLTSRNYKQGSKTQFIYDAVFATAKALHFMHQDLCPNFTGLCDKMKVIDGNLLFNNYILNHTYDDGYGSMIQFDAQGDAAGRYNIMNYKRDRGTGQYGYQIVGSWINGLQLNESDMVWPGGENIVPSSQCSQPCKLGEIKRIQKAGDTCCWVCDSCEDWEYLLDEFTCKDCGLGRWPHPDRKTCYQLEEQHMHWFSIYSIVPMVLSIIGMLTTMFVMLTFLRHNDTPIVKASGRELCYMLLSGCLTCYVMSFLLLARPTPATCAIQRFGVGFGFAAMYSSLLTKTNRISRIFDSASRSAKRPAFISPKSQVVICAILISIQVLSTCIWLVLDPPGTRQYNPNGRRDIVILKCKIEDISFLISLVYNMLLIIICTVYAVKTRKIPENFNESKFIGFTMYTTCIIWLAFVPIYFGTLNSFEVQITTLCISISLSASVTLVCLFAPKMYIIVFQPDKNVRKLTMNSAHYKKAATSTLTGTCTSKENHSKFDASDGKFPWRHETCIPVNSRTSYASDTDGGLAPEQVKLNLHGSPVKTGFGTTETDTDLDRDSMASL
ncbi:metabotropic glutamate receptor 3-like [Lineus longissimus]|uniref:metabotropic glutamate receptor 3-like n=1 Tax=Lineus longissimus TaxID=88925 RepID=UPI00315D6713